VKFTREPSRAVSIRAIGAGEIRVGDRTYEMPVVLTDERVLGEWVAPPVAQLAQEHFHDLVATGPEVIVLGTGSAMEFAPRELTFAFARQAIGFEVMDSAAAARTFNVLAGEGRKVAAVLYP
jgi:uncharacterized protein